MKRVVSILVIAAFLAAPMLVAAQQAKPAAPAAPAAPTAAPAAPAAAPAAPAAAPAKPAEPAKAKKATAKAETVTVTGMVDVVKDKKGKVTGYTLKTDTETYGLKGKSVKAMVGKKVEATGTVATAKGGKKTLTVKQVKEAM
jgi:pyruvate dehydrogenase E2 component (dihydrolipoamide acetyltransferase)